MPKLVVLISSVLLSADTVTSALYKYGESGDQSLGTLIVMSWTVCDLSLASTDEDVSDSPTTLLSASSNLVLIFISDFSLFSLEMFVTTFTFDSWSVTMGVVTCTPHSSICNGFVTTSFT